MQFQEQSCDVLHLSVAHNVILMWISHNMVNLRTLFY